MNTTIPMLFLRGGLAAQRLGEVTLPDIPATIAWMLGAYLPDAYSGRVLAEALEPTQRPAVA